jgi:hypothetical protein
MKPIDNFIDFTLTRQVEISGLDAPAAARRFRRIPGSLLGFATAGGQVPEKDPDIGVEILAACVLPLP